MAGFRVADQDPLGELTRHPQITIIDVEEHRWLHTKNPSELHLHPSHKILDPPMKKSYSDTEQQKHYEALRGCLVNSN